MGCSSVLAIAFAALHVLVAVHGQTTDGDSSSDSQDNYFIIPPKSDAANDPLENLEYVYGQPLNLQWSTTYPVFQIGEFQGPFDIDTTVIHYWPSPFSNVSSLPLTNFGLNLTNWNPPIFFNLSNDEADDRNQFGFVVSAHDGTNRSFHSHTFNLTDVPSSLLESSFSSSQPTPMATSSPSQSTTASSDVHTTTSAASPHDHLQNDHGNAKSNSGLSKDEKIGIGVGVGLGVSLLIVVAGAVVFLFRRRRSRAASEDDGGITPVIEQPKTAQLDSAGR